MNLQTALPPWLQIAWACAGVATLLGGFIWIMFIFWPYLRWSKKMMLDSFTLGQETAKEIHRLQEETKPLIEDARRLLESDKLDKATAAITRLADALSAPVEAAAPAVEAVSGVVGAVADVIQDRLDALRKRRER